MSIKRVESCNTCGEKIDPSQGYEKIDILDYKTRKTFHEYRCKTCYDEHHNKWWRRLGRKIDDVSEKL